jgi:hypothetical protein
MRPTVIADHDVWDGARRIVMAPPDGDLTNDVVRPLEMLVEASPDGSVMYHAKLVLEPGDLDHLVAGGAVWVTFLGVVAPFSHSVAPPAGPAEADSAVGECG